MDEQTTTKQLFKILIAAAWIDGSIQQEERKYLHLMAEKNGLFEDAEIKSLLTEIKAIKPDECYKYLQEYLGTHPTTEEYDQLLESISGLVYSDNNIEVKEAELLSKIQQLEPSHETSQSGFDKLLKAIQKLYRKSLEQTS